MYSDKLSFRVSPKFKGDKDFYFKLVVKDYNYINCPQEESSCRLKLDNNEYTLEITNIKVEEGYSRTDFIDDKTIYTYPNECTTYYKFDSTAYSNFKKSKKISFTVSLYDFLYNQFKPVTIFYNKK